jgi:hypothetical protein
LRLPGETSYAATSQFFISDSDLDGYLGENPYSSSTQQVTYLMNDNIYSRLPSDAAEQLTLDLAGSNNEGYVASLNIGLMYEGESCDWMCAILRLFE